MHDDSPNPIRAAREIRGVTQLQLAAAAGLTIGTISLAERGVVTTRTLEAVAKVLQVPVAQLRSGQDLDLLRARPPNAGQENDMPNESSFITLQQSPHLAAINKALGAGAPTRAEATRAVGDLKKAVEDLGTAQEIAAAQDPVSRVAKAAAGQGARSDLDQAEHDAELLVAAATEMAQRIAPQIRDAPSTLTARELRVKYNTLCRNARAACLEACGIALAAASTASDSAEATALTARATAWSDRAARLREITGVAD